MGNEEAIAQCCLGEVPRAYSQRKTNDPRLPLPTELFPALRSAEPENNTHSCSLRISLQSQGLFINDFAARASMQLLYRLLTQGRIEIHGAFINLSTYRMNPIPIDTTVWARMGYKTAAPERLAA